MSNIDPFAGGEGNPSISFKDAPHGTTYRGRVAELPALVQSRDFETGNPATWPDGNPKMVVCTTLEIDGQLFSLWAPKPSALFAAIKDAQNKAGSQIAVGGILEVTYTHDEPNKTNPRLNPAKQYRVTYTPPDAFGEEPAQVGGNPVASGIEAAPTPAAAANPAETAKQLLASGLGVDDVAAATGLPATTVAALSNLVSAA